MEGDDEEGRRQAVTASRGQSPNLSARVPGAQPELPYQDALALSARPGKMKTLLLVRSPHLWTEMRADHA